MYFAVVALAVVCGLMLGSFFNVVIWRVPRGESIVHPGSHCVACRRPIRPWENIPVLSFIMLGGRCAGCKARISWRYPLVEAATALLSVLLLYALIFPHAARPHSAWEHAFVVLQAASLLVLLPLAVIDFEHYIIPDGVTLPGLGLAAALSLMPGAITPLGSFLGILAGGGSLFALGALGEYVLKKQDAMGGGDIKLMAFVGAVWGWKAALLGIVFGSAFGAAASLVLFLVHLLPKDRRIPFGPFLACGVWIAALWGESILGAYLRLADRLFLPY